MVFLYFDQFLLDIKKLQKVIFLFFPFGLSLNSCFKLQWYSKKTDTVVRFFMIRDWLLENIFCIELNECVFIYYRKTLKQNFE